MTQPVPTIGRIVLYTLNEQDAEAIKASRRNAGEVHLSNEVRAGQEFPAVIVASWGDQPTSACNLKVMLDGPDHFWATSRSVGDGPFHFRWPVRA
ncbi:MAG: hypothetical protein LCH95_13920 [Proteobacteria bacterium]|nr:hypothetical protein [Pseudomonadota bacterium]